jgi:hypothetical protein
MSTFLSISFFSLIFLDYCFIILTFLIITYLKEEVYVEMHLIRDFDQLNDNIVKSSKNCKRASLTSTVIYQLEFN